MAIITISRGSYSEGKEVAEKVAQELGYKCIAREVLLNASKVFNIPEIKFARAIHDGPSILEKFTYGKEKYITYFQSALLREMQSDNVVYHGLAGHFFIKGISHALKVRIMVDIQDRARIRMQREGLPLEKALATIKKDDEERRKWSQHLYGIDTSDPSLYDLLIHLKNFKVDDAADIICHSVRRETFKTTLQSQNILYDLVLAAEIKAALMDIKPDIEVFSKDGHVVLGTKLSLIREPEHARRIEELAKAIPGVKSVEVKLSHLIDWAD